MCTISGPLEPVDLLCIFYLLYYFLCLCESCAGSISVPVCVCVCGVRVSVSACVCVCDGLCVSGPDLCKFVYVCACSDILILPCLFRLSENFFRQCFVFLDLKLNESNFKLELGAKLKVATLLFPSSHVCQLSRRFFHRLERILLLKDPRIMMEILMTHSIARPLAHCVSVSLSCEFSDLRTQMVR